VGGVRVSLQVAILKVLASYPDGRALFGAMKSVLAILAGAGPSWSERLKRLAGRCPNLDIFGQALVIRGTMMAGNSRMPAARPFGRSRSRRRLRVRSSFGGTSRSSLQSTVRAKRFEQLWPQTAAGDATVRWPWTGWHNLRRKKSSGGQTCRAGLHGLTAHPGWSFVARSVGAHRSYFDEDGAVLELSGITPVFVLPSEFAAAAPASDCP
jgi:hypothetical protein